MPDAAKNTEYAGNYVYSDNESVETMKLQFINHPEGYIEPVANTFKSKKRFRFGIDGGGTTTYSSYNYVFQYKDHLGNVRLSYSDADLNGAVDQSEIIEESNYYPFGLKQKGYNYDVTGNGNDLAQQWKFGGKQYQEELDLNWYDVTARNYDAAIGRWMNLDPLAELMRRHSPYNYAFDNPIFFIDPDGMAPRANSAITWSDTSGPCGDEPCPEEEESTTNSNMPTEASYATAGSGNNFNSSETETSPWTGNAQGSHVENKKGGKRFNGFLIEGGGEDKSGKLKGELRGFSAGYENEGESNFHKGASIIGLKASFESTSGYTGMSMDGEGFIGKASTSISGGNYNGENGKTGFDFQLGGELSGIEGSLTPSINVKGVNIGLTLGAALGNLGAGGSISAVSNSNTGEFNYGFNVHFGGGPGGFKLGFKVSNTDSGVSKLKK